MQYHTENISGFPQIASYCNLTLSHFNKRNLFTYLFAKYL